MQPGLCQSALRSFGRALEQPQVESDAGDFTAGLFNSQQPAHLMRTLQIPDGPEPCPVPPRREARRRDGNERAVGYDG